MVTTDRLPDDSYAAVISLGSDLSWTLPGPRARRYAASLVEAATSAEHDAATFHALRCRDIPLDLIGEVITRSRGHRPTVDRWTEPLVLTAGITAAEPHVPFLHAYHRDHPDEGWQWTPGDARQHAAHVMQVVAAATLDSALVRALTDLGVPSETRAAVVDHLGAHWPEEDAR
jgi:hypothetical protein